MPVTRLNEFTKQERILSLGEPERSIPGYHVTLKSETLAIWEKDPASANGVRRITASSSYGGLNTYKPENAVDSDQNTEWASQGPGPARVIISSNLPGTVRSIALLSRKTNLFECWQRVTVVLYRMERRVWTHEFQFVDAATVRLHEIPLPPVESDRIELTFSDPVTQSPTGDQVDPAAVNPGYAEIVPVWSQ